MFSPKAEAILLVNYPFQRRKISPSACTVGYHTIIPWSSWFLASYFVVLFSVEVCQRSWSGRGEHRSERIYKFT